MDEKLTEMDLPHTKILLDPNNYRFHDDASFSRADPSRFHEDTVQERAYRRLRNEGLAELKNSILTNGFLRFERVVVRPYANSDPEMYVVVEGNRRIAAMNWIAEDHAAGVTVRGDVLDALNNIPVIVIEGEKESTYLALMGVRHLSGIREWGGYQRAKLVTELLDDHDLERLEIAARLGMSVHEVNRRYRAFKALHQMEEDEEYGDHAKPTMYPLFHEAVSLPTVRDWLGWEETEARFSKHDQLEQFYDLLAPLEREGRDNMEPKITTYSQIRQLRAILENIDARRVLLDPDRTFSDAAAIAKAEELSKSWATQVAEAIGALTAVSALELARLEVEDLEGIQRLANLAEELLETHRKLTAT